MSVKLRASSGTYNVRASEMARDTHRPPLVKTLRCIVHFLDDSDATFEIDKRAKAQTLLDKVFEHLELIEKDYFGLQFVDTGPPSSTTNADGTYPANVSSSSSSSSPPQNNNSSSTPSDPPPPTITSDVMRWLDPLKTVKKQMRVGPPYVMYFRVKFYVSDPSKLAEEYTRYHFFLQVKKDILEGKLVVPYKTATLLASYAVQSELGDYNQEDHTDGYLSDMRFIPNHTEEFEKEVMELHKQHRLGNHHHQKHPLLCCSGQTPADAEYNFLEKAKRSEMYGVDLHHARCFNISSNLYRDMDQSNLDIQLGVMSVGLVVFQNNLKINTFPWSKIVKISFKRKQFFIQLRKELNENVENLIGFNMVSYRSCKNLWKSCVEHHTFFRLHSSSHQPKSSSLFSIGSKFRYSGRTEFQTIEDSKKKARIERTFTRSPSKRYARRTVGGTTRDAILGEAMYRPPPPHSTSMDFHRPHPPPQYPHMPTSLSYPNSLRSSSQHNSPAHHGTNSMYGVGVGSQGSGSVQSGSMGMGSSQLGQYHYNHQQQHAPQSTSKSNTPQHDSFQHTPIRATLPNDYKANDYALKPTTTQQQQQQGHNGAHNGNGWATLEHPRRGNRLRDENLTPTSTLGSRGSNHYSNPRPLGTGTNPPSVVSSNSGIYGNNPDMPMNNIPGASNLRQQEPWISSRSTIHTFNDSRSEQGSLPGTLEKRGSRAVGNRGVTNRTNGGVGGLGVGGVGGVGGQMGNGGVVKQQNTLASSSAASSPAKSVASSVGGGGGIGTNGNHIVKNVDDDDGGFLEHTRDSTNRRTLQPDSNLIPPTVPPKMSGSGSGGGYGGMEQLDNKVTSTEQSNYEMPPAYIENNMPNGSTLDGPGLVTIRMKPDSQGRFGFNVKGGADQKLPIIVSRVAAGTPADVCIPRLNEGDQVLHINGRDVSQHSHEQVVMFIRASRETHSGELVLIVRPNVYIGEEPPDEPDFQYIPDTHQISSTLPPGGDPLDGSIMLLTEGLQSGAAIAQFEQLYRKKTGMTMNAARLLENIPRNRYKDISPYDQTRVKIKGHSGDYINANFVNMEIPGSGIINRYIAAQGPLPNTCCDFWTMVWEQQCTLVVMLTTNVERGRVKCHQYWPDLYETTEFTSGGGASLQLTCLREELTASFAFREFTLVNNKESSSERHITHMQYNAWPDHGVPDDSGDFLAFVHRVRARRAGMVEPTVVHCSAGIGRTGVLITMETAMCLIEANQPVYPLDILRQERDQRAMLIQTSSQYKFVCEAILRVYNDKIVQPLDDYKR